MTQAVNAQDTRVYVKVDDIWTRIYEITAVPELGFDPATIEATNLDSHNVERIDGVPDVGSPQYTCNAIPSGGQDSNLDLFMNKLSRDIVYDWKVVMPKLNAEVLYKASETWKLGAAEPNKAMSLTFTTAIRGDLVIAGLAASYTLTYDPNMGTGTVTDTASPYDNGATVTVMAGTGLTAPANKKFLCWNDQADGSGHNYYAGTQFTIYRDMMLYAVYVDEE